MWIIITKLISGGPVGSRQFYAGEKKDLPLEIVRTLPRDSYRQCAAPWDEGKVETTAKAGAEDGEAGSGPQQSAPETEQADPEPEQAASEPEQTGSETEEAELQPDAPDSPHPRERQPSQRQTQPWRKNKK